MNRVLKDLFLIIPIMMTLTSCSYIETVKRAKYNEEIKGTAAYYDDKCLVAEECAAISGKITLPLDDISDTLAVVAVLEDENISKVVDATVINFTPEKDAKVSYFFFDLPVGNYVLYALKTEDNTHDFQNSPLVVLGKETSTITHKDLQTYQNVIVLKDASVDSSETEGLFSRSIQAVNKQLAVAKKGHIGYFDADVDLDDPIFSHNMAKEGLYYPESFRRKTKAFYRLAPRYKEGSIPLIFVHGMGGTPRDWKYMLKHINLEHYTPYAIYYPSGDDFSKLAALFSEWIMSDKIFNNGNIAIIAHSYGGVIVREAFNVKAPNNRGLFISLASPFGGNKKASEGVQNAPYVLPAWRSIADNGIFIKNLYRNGLAPFEEYQLIFAYNNHEEGPSGDGIIPLEKQLRLEAYNEAISIRGFNEDHVSILRSREAVDYINTLLSNFADENLKK